MTRVQYTKEFKLSAVDLAEQLGSITAAAKQLNIPDSSLYNWKIKYRPELKITSKTTVPPVVMQSNELDELKRLRKENEELKKVNTILKRAAAFFSQDHLK